MTVAPVRPISAAEVALRVELTPQPGVVIKPAEVPPVVSPQGAVADHVALRTPTTSAATPSAAGREATPAEAVRSALQSAAARQTALGPLLADLAQAARTAGLTLPLKAAAAQALAAQPQLSEEPTAAEIKTALSRSGLFLEARLAAALPETAGADVRRAAQALAAELAVRGDAKAALLAFRETVKTWLASQSATTAASVVITPKPPPAPPYSGGPTSGQPPAAPSLPPDAGPIAVAQRLLQGATGALARHELLQMMSIPDASSAAAGAASWMFELPVSTPQGPAVAQFEVSRDGGRGSPGAEAQPVWRARFSLDIEPLGAVHAHVSLRAGHTSVNLWAERAETAELLRGEGGALLRLLRRGDMAAELNVHEGAPRARLAAAGQFVDEAS